MDFDFKLDKVIEVFDLVKRLSWGAIPMWFALTLPVIYIAYKKLLPTEAGTPPPSTFLERLGNWFSLPQMDRFVIYLSLAMFVIGTITLLVDQRQKEAIRNDGIRIKGYLQTQNLYSVNKRNLIAATGIKQRSINEVLYQYPSEFILVDTSTLILLDSIPYNRIINNSEKLLASYLSDTIVHTPVAIDDLLTPASPYFTRDVVKKLIVDSPSHYRFCITADAKSGIDRK